MSLIVLGTDTDAGKTTFSLLWLAAFADEYAYWKPVETGDSDTKKVRRLVPQSTVFEPIARFHDPVAPPLAARREGKSIPSSKEIVAQCTPHAPREAVPHAERDEYTMEAHSQLLIETFGSPFSPLNEHELQIALIQRLELPSVLISSSAVGCIGRTLALLQSLKPHGVMPIAVVLMGDADDYAAEQVAKHGSIRVFQARPPDHWNGNGLESSSRSQRDIFLALRELLAKSAPMPEVPANILELDRKHVWHPYTSLRDPDPPLSIIGAQDEFLHLSDGREIIDAISSWWTILHGHREPRLMAALHEAAQSFDHVLFAGATHTHAVKVAELLLQTVPWIGGRVFFSDNGSTAVEVALKMAYQAWHHRGEPGRTLFIGFENGYHGDTFGAMAVGRDPLFFGKFEPLLFRAEQVPVSAERLDDALKRNAGRVGAVIIEPLVQGAGGMLMHSPEELRAIFEVTKKHGVFFIADEVMTGCYRTGTMWAFQAAGIVPDLICASKTLAGGILPLAVTMASPEIVAAFDTADRDRTFFHGHSFTAHPLACAIAATNLDILMHEPPAPARMEAFWNGALAPLRDHPRVKNVRIRGTIAAVEIDVPGGYLAKSGREIRRRCLGRGVMLRPLGNVLYALPPFGTSTESLSRIAEAIRLSISGV